MIKRTVLFIVVFTLFFSALLAHPVEKINNWAKKQTDNIDAQKVVNFLTRDKEEGDITFGAEYSFNPATSYSISATTLDATHFVIAYQDVGNGSYGTAIVGTVLDTTISYGTEYVFNSSPTVPFATTLDATHFVVVYSDQGNNNYGTALVGTVTGSDISWAYESVFNYAITYYCVATALDAMHFVVAYNDGGNSNYGTAIVGTISEPITYIEFGDEYVFNSGDTSYCSATTLDAAHFVVAYSDQEGYNLFGTTIVGVVSGTGNDATISYRPGFVYDLATPVYNSTTTLDANHFVVAYCSYYYPSYGKAIVGTVTDSSISCGSEYVFNPGTTTYCSATALDATHFVIAYNDGSNPLHGSAIVGTVSDSDISYGYEYTFSLYGAMNSAITLDETHFINAYSDASYGNSIVGEVEGISPPPAPVDVEITINGSDLVISWDEVIGASSYISVSYTHLTLPTN